VAARQKLAAGADLVQLYTGMVFEGPGLPARIVAELAAAGS
jgi:dihydroorotate dehydrogenase